MKSDTPDKKRTYKHFPPGTDVGLINDPAYTESVKKSLKNRVLNILKFDPVWQKWIVEHPEYLPAMKSDYKVVLNNQKLDVLLRRIFTYIKAKDSFTNDDKEKIIELIILIHIQGGIPALSNRTFFESLFTGKVV